MNGKMLERKRSNRILRFRRIWRVKETIVVISVALILSLNLVKCATESKSKLSQSDLNHVNTIDHRQLGPTITITGDHKNGNGHDHGHHHHKSSGGVDDNLFNSLNDEYNDYDYDEDDEEDDDEDEELSIEQFKQFGDEDIDSIESRHHQISNIKPKVGKCCPMGEALNSKGICDLLSPKHHHLRDIWYPETYFDGKISPTNITNWDVTIPHRFTCPSNRTSEIIQDSSKFVLFEDGSLYVSHLEKEVEEPMKFCFDHQIGSRNFRVVMGCFKRQDFCSDSKCNIIRKCCPDQTLIEEGNFKCIGIKNATKLPFPSISNASIIHGDPNCQYGQVLLDIGSLKENNLDINDVDGTLSVNSSTNISFLDYCLDYFVSLSQNHTYPYHHHYSHAQLKIMRCLPKESQIHHPGQFNLPTGLNILYGVAFILSAIFLLIAALISLKLPELRSLHGKCQLSHLATLFFLFVFLATVHLENGAISQGFCTFFAVAIHMCALSSFLWLNLLCVNIYLTFRTVRPPLSARRDENKRLIFLCVYAWGIPFAFCIFLYILDKSGDRIDPMPRPGYGELKCLISNREAEFSYLFGPIGFLLLCNAIMFLLTAKELLCGLWKLENSDSLTFRRKSMGIVVAKLIIVMGLGWILDVISWAVGKDYQFFLYTSDLFNSLQGVLICIVLVWRQRVLEVLNLRKSSTAKDETFTQNRPFLTKNSSMNHHQPLTNGGEQDTSLIIVQDNN